MPSMVGLSGFTSLRATTRASSKVIIIVNVLLLIVSSHIIINKSMSGTVLLGTLRGVAIDIIVKIKYCLFLAFHLHQQCWIKVLEM